MTTSPRLMAERISLRVKSNSAMAMRRIRSDKTLTTGTTPRLGKHSFICKADKWPRFGGAFFLLACRALALSRGGRWPSTSPAHDGAGDHERIVPPTVH